MEIEGADKNRSVRFNLARQIFLACEFLDRFPVCAEHLHLVLPVAPEIIIDRFAGDFAPHTRFEVLPPKNHELPIEDPLLVRFADTLTAEGLGGPAQDSDSLRLH
jgi:hypothetical protein